MLVWGRRTGDHREDCHFRTQVDDTALFSDFSLRITTAQYPVPSVCARDQIDDWFAGLAQCLHWNVRQQQKPLPTTVSTTSLDSVDLSN